MNDAVATGLSVRVVCLATGAWCAIKNGARTLDVQLRPGRAAAVSLREDAADLRERGARMLRRADFMEQAASALEQVSP